MMLGERKDADCYFYYYSSCSKGPNCPFRHEPAALRNETVCVYWKAGKCSKNNCIFRHMEIHKQRDKIPCYFETQPTGCKKAHCPFFHSEVRTQEEVEKVEGVIMPVSSSNQTGAATPPNTTNALPTPPTTMPKPPKEVIVNLHDGESDQESIPSPKKKESDEGREEAKEEEEEEEEEGEEEEEEEEEIIQTIVLEEHVEEVEDVDHEDNSQLSRDKILSTSDDLRLLLSRKPASRNPLHPSPPANRHAAAAAAVSTRQDGTGRHKRQKAAVVQDYEASIEQKLAQFKASAATNYSVAKVCDDAKLDAEDPEDRFEALKRRRLAESQETGLHRRLKLQTPEETENLRVQGISRLSKVAETKESGLQRRLKHPKQVETENLRQLGVSQRLQAPQTEEQDRFEVLKRRRLTETKETGIQQRLKFKPQVNEAEEDFSLQGESQDSTTLDAETLDPEDRFEFLKRRRLAETREIGVKKRLGALGGKPDISQRLQQRNLTKSDVLEDRKRLRLTETDHGSLADNSALQFSVSGSEEEGLNLPKQDRKLPQNRLSGRELVRLSLRGDITSVYKGETKSKNLLNRALTDAFSLKTGSGASEKTGALKGRLGKTSSVSVPSAATSAGSSSVKTRLGGAVSSSSSSSAPSSSSSSSSSASSSTLDFKIKSLSEIKASRSTTTTTTTTTASAASSLTTTTTTRPAFRKPLSTTTTTTTTISPPAITSTTPMDLEEELLLEGDILDSDEEIDEDQLLL